MKIVIDSLIPFTEGVFEPYAEVVYKEGPAITAADVRDADALMIRTRTRCDAALLEGSSVKIIATATVSTDNIDRKYCESHGICLRNASGCNAGGVMNYVFSALYGMASRHSIRLDGMNLGIIGVGAAGSKVEETGKALGFNILRYDSLKAKTDWYTDYYELRDLLPMADIVTMHIPLNENTRGIADSRFFKLMKPGAIFINAAHGDLVVEDALLEARPKLGPIALDSWSGEPNINRALLDDIEIATPHIAGYTLRGKQIGTMMAVRNIARFFGLEKLYLFFPKTEEDGYQSVRLDVHGKQQGQIASMIQYNYPIFTDDFMFRMNPDGFAEMRERYQYRKEFIIQ